MNKIINWFCLFGTDPLDLNRLNLLMRGDTKLPIKFFELVKTTASKGLGFGFVNLNSFVKKRRKPTSLPKWAMVRTEELSIRPYIFRRK